jgi:hypothetical protein
MLYEIPYVIQQLLLLMVICLRVQQTINSLGILEFYLPFIIINLSLEIISNGSLAPPIGQNLQLLQVLGLFIR